MKLLIGRVGVNFRVVLMAIPLVLVALLMPYTTMASVITIEPDDFDEGTDLSNVSPYVALKESVLVTNDERVSQAVYATRSNPRFRAPTGELVFGSFPYLVSGPSCSGGIECSSGFEMTFHRPVSWVSLLYQNWNYGYEAGPGLPAEWSAYDTSGDRIAGGTEGNRLDGNLGQVFSLNLAIPNMKSLVVGGHDGINAMEFDRLSFAVRVPEPTPLALLAISLGAIIFSRNRKLFRVVR